MQLMQPIERPSEFCIQENAFVNCRPSMLTKAVETTTIESDPQNDEEIFEVDGVRLDNIDLPKRWRTLKRHYTFST